MVWNNFFSKIWIFIFIASIFTACGDNEPTMPEMDTTPYNIVLPEGFPMLEFPEGNELTVARVDLGKKLFYDPILSRDSSVSCGSCHLQTQAFTDGKALSDGVAGGITKRNSPTLANVAYHDLFFKDGGSISLELQVIAPIEDENEMDNSILDVVERLKNVPEYVDMMVKAYGRTPDVYSITRSIASFQRTLISGNSRYDQYLHQNQNDALNASEIRGMNLFFSDSLACSQCHSGFNFTANAFENNGLYDSYVDKGRFRITIDSSDIGKFKVPTLRNIALTAPYMHDGSVSNLAAVVQHYANGGSHHPNKSSLIQPRTLSAQAQADLVHFLESLTDEAFINNPAFGKD